MNILIVLNYYFPYISGLSECARFFAEELAKDYNVFVLTAKHQDDLQETELINNVTIIRSNVLLKINKGVVSPSFIFKFMKLQKKMDIIWFHMPMIEAGILAYLTDPRKLICTYHCDINLPKSLMNKAILSIMDFSSKIGMRRARHIIVTSIDYAKHSRFLTKFINKLVEIQPVSPFYSKLSQKASRKNDKFIIGFCGRIVEEKGIDVLLQAAPKIHEIYPYCEFHIAGDYLNVAGGSIYEKLKREAGWDSSYVKFLGKLPENDIINFYQAIDLLVLPSINSLEAFGMVQVEAMLCGVPVITTDLPGVRTIIQKTGMGEIVRPKDVDSLVEGIFKVIENINYYIKERTVVEEYFGGVSAMKKLKQLI